MKNILQTHTQTDTHTHTPYPSYSRLEKNFFSSRQKLKIMWPVFMTKLLQQVAKLTFDPTTYRSFLLEI